MMSSLKTVKYYGSSP